MRLLTPKEAKDRLRVSLSLIYQLVEERRIKAVRIGGRNKSGCIRIPEEAIDEFVKGATAELED